MRRPCTMSGGWFLSSFIMIICFHFDQKRIYYFGEKWWYGTIETFNLQEIIKRHPNQLIYTRVVTGAGASTVARGGGMYRYVTDSVWAFRFDGFLNLHNFTLLWNKTRSVNQSVGYVEITCSGWIKNILWRHHIILRTYTNAITLSHSHSHSHL